jgi:hypothetical protein
VRRRLGTATSRAFFLPWLSVGDDLSDDAKKRIRSTLGTET